MTNIILKDELKIESMIYEIRGKQVMIDSDLAKLYHVETKRINEAVKNNPDKFPERYYFKMTKEECLCSRSKFSTLNIKDGRGHNIKYLPSAFTEQGIYMLATILKSSKATQVTLNIMDTFVMMRHFIGNNLIELKYINNQVLKNTEDIKLLQETFDKFIKPEESNHLFFKGQFYDAYSLLLNIFNKSSNEIIIIDNYIDRNLLDILSKTKKKILIVTNKYNNQYYDKYKEQYSNVKIIINNNYHDRFIIIDKKTLYHSGASFKDLGKKCFEISKIDDKDILNKLLENVNKYL